MDLINVEDLEGFVSREVGITIYDQTWTDQSPFQSNKVSKVEICPNKTHLRIYFGKMRFFAIPRTAEIKITESNWTAIDQESGLHFVIKRECEEND